MTSPALATNGASLTNCHTNVFALTELNGLQWKRFAPSASSHNVNFSPGERGQEHLIYDPLLLSYGRCLNANLLTAWKRTQSVFPNNFGGPIPTASSGTSTIGNKKLWVFWYGEEPDLSPLLEPELIEEESGGWENELSYECRVLLFRALHTLIERCLLSQKYVRLGRWFVQAADVGTNGTTDSGFRYSYAFEFFLHGDSTVCATVDVRLHPQLVRFSKLHLPPCGQHVAGAHKMSVILCPYALAGVLTGKMVQGEKARELLQQWKLYFPLDLSESSPSRPGPNPGPGPYSPRDSSISVMTPGPSPNDVSAPSPAPDTPNPNLSGYSGSSSNDKIKPSSPCFVEVIVAGARMWYPSSFVLLVDEDRLTQLVKSNAAVHNRATALPPLVVPPGSLKSAKNVRTKHRTGGRILTPSGRNGLNGVPEVMGRNQPDSVSGLLSSAFQDLGLSKSKDMAGDRSGRLMGFPEAGVGGVVGSKVPEICDGAEKRACDCDACRGVVELVPPRASSPDSSPLNYSSAQGLTLIAMKVKAAQDGPKHDQQSALDHSKHAKPSFHRRMPMTNTAEEDLLSKPLVPPSRSYLVSDAYRNLTGYGSPRKALHGILSPGIYPKTPATPSSQLGSVVQVSPVSSPASACASVPSPVTPATPFMPRTPKTPKSIGASRPSIMERGEAGGIAHVSAPPANLTQSLNPSLLRKPPPEFFHSILNCMPLKRPHLSQLLLSDEDTDNIGLNEPVFGCDEDTGWALSDGGSNKRQNTGQMTSAFTETPLIEGWKPLVKPVVTTATLLQVFGKMEPIGANVVRSTVLPQLGDETISIVKSFPGTIDPLELARMFPTPPSLESQPTSSPMETQQNHEINVPSAETEETAGATSSFEEVPTKTALPSSVLISSAKYTVMKDVPSNGQVAPLFPVSFERLAYRPLWYIQPRFQYVASASGAGRFTARGRAGQPSPAQGSRSSSVRSPRMSVFSPGGQSGLGSPMRPSVPMPPPPQQKIRNFGEPAFPLPPPYGANMTSCPPSPAVNPQLPECRALLFNLLMGDTMMNFFADKNFSGCTVCVCNMSVRSNECVGSNGGQNGLAVDEHPYKCSCGFSQVVNRRFSCMSGLFEEDEYEVTGFRQVASNKRRNLSLFLEMSIHPEQEVLLNKLPDSVVTLLRCQYSNPFLSFDDLSRDYVMLQMDASTEERGKETWQFQDMNRICSALLTLCKPPGSSSIPPLSAQPENPLHFWLQDGQMIDNNAEFVRIQQLIQPSLQEAVQLRRQTRLWDKVFTVEGPLTWKDFLRFADKEVMEDQKEALPIPSWIVGLDKERLLISPTAWSQWEVLAMEPYGSKRDVAYIVLAPDNDYMLHQVKAFFRDFSKTYEMCGLGRHLPVPSSRHVPLVDGIITVNRADRLSNDNLDDWFRYIGESAIAQKMRMYGTACRNLLGPYLASQKQEGHLASMFLPPPPPPPRPLPEGSSSTDPAITPSLAVEPALATATVAPSSAADIINMTSPNYPFDPGYPEREDPHPLIVLYLIDPFTYGPKCQSLHRLACIGLLRSYQELLKSIPESMHDSMVLQILPAQALLDSDMIKSRSDLLRSLALGVYAQNLRKMIPKTAPKMLTGFGPATAFKKWLEERGAQIPGMAFNPPYILLPHKERNDKIDGLGEVKEGSHSLFFAYCITEDQRWLLVSCTDERGEMLDTQIISIWVADRMRQRGWSVVKYSLLRLWDFVLGTMTKLTSSCRIIMGRVGRLGHGELKGWSTLLSKKALARSCQQLRQMCNQCRVMGSQEIPNILSACLISLQPEVSLKIAADAYTHDERLPSSAILCPLTTPEEASCTHLYVFPTSATAAHSHVGPQAEDMVADDIDFLGQLGPEFGTDEGDQGGDGIDFLRDIFSFGDNGMTSPVASPRAGGDFHSRPLSPSQTLKDGQTTIKGQESLDEPGQLLQQPLAVGYLVSTAPIGPMPRWFFTGTDQNQHSCPVILMSALHIHSANVLQGDDVYHSVHHSRNAHPLDSSLTADVLKHVLECYNALSWLIMEPSSRDRRSCLPLHIQVLMQLYLAASVVL